MIYLLPDDFHGQERLAQIQASCGDPETVAMNTTKLEGPRLPLDQLVSAAAAMPFLAEKRLVVVRRLLAQSERAPEDGERRRGRQQQEQLRAIAEWLPELPPTTELVFVESTPPAHNSSNPVVQAIVRLGGEVFESPKLQPEAVRDWIVRRTTTKGGRIGAEAAMALAAALRDDLARIDLELEKLVTYALDRPVEVSDVHALVAETREESIFHLVDAVGMRDRRQALSVLHELLREGTAVPMILTMIARQLRLLLQTGELLAQRADQGTITRTLRLSPWQVGKLIVQARRFGVGDLERAYHRLLETDQSVKTGRLEPEVAVDLLVADLTAR